MFDRQRKEEAVGSDMKNTEADGKIHGMHGQFSSPGMLCNSKPTGGWMLQYLDTFRQGSFFSFLWIM